MEFENGKIYTIRSSMTDKYYIGSTNQKTLAQRLGKHRSNYNDYLKDNTKSYVTSYEILQYDDHYIELLELCPCNTKDELRQREGQLQRQYKNEMVNKVISCRTVIERLKDNKEQIAITQKAYNESHKEERNAYAKAYKKTHKQETAITTKAYYESHKEDIKDYRESHKEQRKAYYESHKEEIKAKDKARYQLQKEQINARDKVYRESHKEEIKAKDKARYQVKKLLLA